MTSHPNVMQSVGGKGGTPAKTPAYFADACPLWLNGSM